MPRTARIDVFSERDDPTVTQNELKVIIANELMNKYISGCGRTEKSDFYNSL